ncbi:MIP family channel protein [Nocardioides pyridinolyticus]
MAEQTALPGLQQKLTAEVLGTFVLVLFGCGSMVYAGEVGTSTTVTTVGLAFGLAVAVMAYAFGRVSGAHFNPAVSLGAAVGGRLSWVHAAFYALAQVAGAFLGALVLFLLMQGFSGFDAEGGMGQNFFGDQSPGDYAAWAAFLLELVMTMLFVTVVLAVTDERFEHPALAPLAIGLTLAAIYFVAIPATGASVNPARSIGPALFAGGDAIVQLWLFILAPLAGAAIAGIAYPLFFGRSGDPVPGSGWSMPQRVTAVVGPDQYQQQWNEETTSTTATYGIAPIVQDGWQWDPVGQSWHPVGQTPEQWRAQQAAQEQAAAAEPEPEPELPGEQTQIRPPQ